MPPYLRQQYYLAGNTVAYQSQADHDVTGRAKRHICRAQYQDQSPDDAEASHDKDEHWPYLAFCLGENVPYLPGNGGNQCDQAGTDTGKSDHYMSGNEIFRM